MTPAGRFSLVRNIAFDLSGDGYSGSLGSTGSNWNNIFRDSLNLPALECLFIDFTGWDPSVDMDREFVSFPRRRMYSKTTNTTKDA